MAKKQIFEEGTDRFFRDRWKEKTIEEEGHLPQHHTVPETEAPKEAEEEEKEASEIENKKAVDIYLEMYAAIDDDEELQPLLADLDRAIVHYATASKIYSHSKQELVTGKESAEKDKEESDLAKHLAHNAVISALSALSRAYVKKRGANLWRVKIDDGTGDRHRIAKWVKEVAPFVSDKINGV